MKPWFFLLSFGAAAGGERFFSIKGGGSGLFGFKGGGCLLLAGRGEKVYVAFGKVPAGKGELSGFFTGRGGRLVSGAKDKPRRWGRPGFGATI
jgi:hypothetical protein